MSNLIARRWVSLKLRLPPLPQASPGGGRKWPSQSTPGAGTLDVCASVDPTKSDPQKWQQMGTPTDGGL